MPFLTVAQVVKACKEHDFILFRFKSGHLMGVNTKVLNIVLKQKGIDFKRNTDYIGLQPCNFQTYISHKHGFKR